MLGEERTLKKELQWKYLEVTQEVIVSKTASISGGTAEKSCRRNDSAADNIYNKRVKKESGTCGKSVGSHLPGGGGDSHIKGAGMLAGNFELNP